MPSNSQRFELSKAHIDTINRRRRVVVNFDVLLVEPMKYESIEAIVEDRFTFIDDPDTCMDSIWWNWGEGNIVPYPSKFLPRYNEPGYQQWFAEGVDIVRIFQEETHRRGLEGFYSHRMNGADNDPQYSEEQGSFIDDVQHLNPIPLKREHPDWVFKLPWNPNGLWNFAVQEVRDYTLRNLRELAENYEFDGLELDYARSTPLLPPGRAWEHRHGLTELMRNLRAMTLEVEAQRGRPFLLAARVPENLPGCHFDGLNVEKWAREQLVDIFAVGCRSFEVDVAAFRRITDGTPIKLYCALDDHHSTDGYCAPPIEVLRGVFANWYRQGADGVQTFNFKYAPDPGELHWDMHLQAYHELGDPDKIRYLDKTFVVQRRGGGHGPQVVANPEDWSTPRWAYFNTNMLAQLPAALNNEGRADTLLTIYVGDDVNEVSERRCEIGLRLLLNDPAAAGLPAAQRLDPVLVREYIVPRRVGGPGPAPHRTEPPARGLENQIEVRINNQLLEQMRVEEGWLVYQVQPLQLAVGENLVGVRVDSRPPEIGQEILIEKLELQVRYL